VKLISLDLGTKTGFATGINGEIKSHGFKFWQHDKHFSNESFVNFRKWLLTGAKNVHKIIVEKPNGGLPGFEAYRVLFGMYGIVQEVCGICQIDLISLSATGIKKYWTGDGRADKARMVLQTQVKGFRDVVDHNESDAIAAYHYYYEKIRTEGTAHDSENDLPQ
jgi:hypothetical protein